MWGKKLTPNLYAVTDGSCMEIWDSIGSYIRVPFSVKYPSWGFTLPLIFYHKSWLFFGKRERKKEKERSSKENNQQ